MGPTWSVNYEMENWADVFREAAVRGHYLLVSKSLREEWIVL